MYKIIGADGQQYGPVSLDQMRRWIAENRIQGSTLVLPAGATDWRPVYAIPELAAELKLPPPIAGTRGDVANRASNKVAAGVCGILLGGFGVHKFILGYTDAGITMLLISVLTCGLAQPIMHLIGLIEGILYLTKSDEEFVRTYVDGRQTWF
jgi:TM2 domain-containing membrane protein YozV